MNRTPEPFGRDFFCRNPIENPRVDWSETPDAHVFEVDIPGYKKEEVKVEFENKRLLQITGERYRWEKWQRNVTYWRLEERKRGRFVRRFPLPCSVMIDETVATMQNGVLTVVVPKKTPEYKEVRIFGANPYWAYSTQHQPITLFPTSPYVSGKNEYHLEDVSHGGKRGYQKVLESSAHWYKYGLLQPNSQQGGSEETCGQGH